MPKHKKCRCGEMYYQYTTLQNRCPKCLAGRAKKAREKTERKEHKKAKESLKTRSDWLREAQQQFNRYIRARDHGKVCISCQKPPKKKNAGHYRSVGAAPELRFNEDNVHLQCEHCNTFNSGNAIEYRINLVKKLGMEQVKHLEGPHLPKKYTIDEIKEIKAKYSKMARDLERLL